MKITFENILLPFQSHKSEIILGLCTLFLAFVIAKAVKKSKYNFPPGPKGLPVVGYLPFLTKDIHLDLMELGKKYGDVFRIKLGSQDILILNGADAIVEALNKSEFLGRPAGSAMQKAFPSSIFFGSNFLLWKEQRKSVVQFMKELGLGKTKIEENVIVEVNHFMDFLRNSEAQPIDIRNPIRSSLSNNISSLIFGERFEYDDPKRQFLDENLNEIFENFSQVNLEWLFPWISYIPFLNKFFHFQRSVTALKSYKNFFLKEINEHVKTLIPTHVRGFIDRYLVEIDKKRVKHPDTSYNKDMLISTAIDLFASGSEAVEASLLWFIYIIAAFPNVQKKVQHEIMEIIGPDKTPEYMDRKYMPYTRAFMMEAMRWKVVLPLALMHSTLVDTTVGGYKIQKHQALMYNLWAIHHDPRYWKEPEKFKAERFLSEDGMSLIRPRHFIPFLAGERACPGQSMAQMELFLYLTSILQEFDVSFPDETETTFNGKFRLTYRPEPYLVRFIPKK